MLKLSTRNLIIGSSERNTCAENISIRHHKGHYNIWWIIMDSCTFYGNLCQEITNIMLPNNVFFITMTGHCSTKDWFIQFNYAQWRFAFTGLSERILQQIHESSSMGCYLGLSVFWWEAFSLASHKTYFGTSDQETLLYSISDHVDDDFIEQ